MRTLLIALVAMIGASAMADSTGYGFTTSEFGGAVQVSYFDYREDILEWFQSRDLQGGGYTWEALVRSALELQRSPYADDVEYNSEGDAFFATVSSEEASEALKDVFRRLTTNESFRLECMAHAQRRGDLE
jgi:hypothetical protein